MTGPEHYRAAETLQLQADKVLEDSSSNEILSWLVADMRASAQVHATLALAAATAPKPPSTDIRHAWISAIYGPQEATS